MITQVPSMHSAPETSDEAKSVPKELFAMHVQLPRIESRMNLFKSCSVVPSGNIVKMVVRFQNARSNEKSTSARRNASNVIGDRPKRSNMELFPNM